jgi:hypothetical protein
MNMNRQRNLLVVKNVERETKGSLPVFLAQWGGREQLIDAIPIVV